MIVYCRLKGFATGLYIHGADRLNDILYYHKLIITGFQIYGTRRLKFGTIYILIVLYRDKDDGFLLNLDENLYTSHIISIFLTFSCKSTITDRIKYKTQIPFRFEIRIANAYKTKTNFNGAESVFSFFSYL